MASMLPMRLPSRAIRVRPSQVRTVSMSGMWVRSFQPVQGWFLLVLTRCGGLHDADVAARRPVALVSLVSAAWDAGSGGAQEWAPMGSTRMKIEERIDV